MKANVDFSHKRRMTKKEFLFYTLGVLFLSFTISSTMFMFTDKPIRLIFSISSMVLFGVLASIMYFLKYKEEKKDVVSKNQYITAEQCKSNATLFLVLEFLNIIFGIIMLFNLNVLFLTAVVEFFAYILIIGEFQQQKEYIEKQNIIDNGLTQIDNAGKSDVIETYNFICSIYQSASDKTLKGLCKCLQGFEKFRDVNHKYHIDDGYVSIRGNVLTFSQGSTTVRYNVADYLFSGREGVNNKWRIDFGYHNVIFLDDVIYYKLKNELDRMRKSLNAFNFSYDCASMISKYFNVDIKNLPSSKQFEIESLSVKNRTYDEVKQLLIEQIDYHKEEITKYNKELEQVLSVIKEKKLLTKHKKVIDNFIKLVGDEIWTEPDLLREFTFYIENEYLSEIKDEPEPFFQNYYDLDEVIEDFRDIILEAEGLTNSIQNCKFIYMLVREYLINKFGKKAKKEFELLSIDTYINDYINNSAILQDDGRNILLLSFYAMSENIKKGKVFDVYDDIEQTIKEETDKQRKNHIKSKLLGNSIVTNNINIDDIDIMTGSEFEEFVGKLFKSLGYKSSVTKLSGDQGLDVILEKAGMKTGIQCKRYTGKISNKAVQEAVAGKAYYKLDKVMVITNSYFTKSAQELAEVNDVILWDRDIIIEKLKKFKG